MWTDFVVAGRTLRRQAGLWTLAVVALSVGIGLNTSIYAILHSIFDLPQASFDQPGTVIYQVDNPKLGLERRRLSANDYKLIHDNSTSYARCGAYQFSDVAITGEGAAERVDAARIAPEFFALTSGRLQLGRSFQKEEMEKGRDKVAILTDKLWKRRFGGDPSIVGRNVRLDRQVYRIVGVTDARTWFPSTTIEIFLPLTLTDGAPADRIRDISMVAQLKPGVTRERAQAEAARLMEQRAQISPDHSGGWQVSVLPPDGIVSPQDKAATSLLQILGLLILLLACVNVSNLLLVRAIGRRREIAVRLAVGAGWKGLARQVLAEAIWLVVPAAVISVAAAHWSAKIMLRGFPNLNVVIPENPIDPAVLFNCIAIAVVAVLVFSFAPLWQTRRVNLNEALHAGARTGSDRTSRRMTRMFVVAQTALAMCLLVTAVYVSKGIANGVDRQFGFDSKNLGTFSFSLASDVYADDAKVAAFYDEALRRARSISGVEMAGALTLIPSIDGNGSQIRYAGPQSLEQRPGELPGGTSITVKPGSLEALRLPLRRGRMLSTEDRAGSTPVTVISQTAASKLYPGQDPIGRPVRIVAAKDVTYTIVGVVGDTLNGMPNLPPPVLFYLSADQAPVRWMTIAVRGPASVLPSVRAALQSIDPDEPILVDTVEARAYRFVEGGVTFSSLLKVMGALALFLAAVGIFSLLAYQVSGQTREIGVRMALGASAGGIQRGVIWHGMRLILPGLVAGAGLAMLLGRQLEPLLFKVRATDPEFPAIAGALLLLAGALAAAVPSTRAARVEPMTALRAE